VGQRVRLFSYQSLLGSTYVRLRSLAADVPSNGCGPQSREGEKQ